MTALYMNPLGLYADNAQWQAGTTYTNSGGVSFSTTSDAFSGGRHLILNGGYFQYYQFFGLYTAGGDVTYGSIRMNRIGDASISGVLRVVSLSFYNGTAVTSTLAWMPDGTFQFRQGDLGTNLGGVSLGLPTGTWRSFQWRLVTASGSGGQFTLRANGSNSNILHLTGINTLPSGSAQITGHVIRQDGANPNFSGARLRDLWLNDDQGSINNSWPGDMRVEPMMAAGAGSLTEFATRVGAATNHQAVSDYPSNGDTSYVEDNTVGRIDYYTIPQLPAYPTTVRAAMAFAQMRKNGAGSKTGGVVLKSGASETTEKTNAALSASAYTLELGTLRENNPNTAAAWTTPQVEAAQPGIKVVA